MNKKIYLFILLLCSVASFAQEVQNSEVPQTIPELKSAIEKILQETGTPGAGIALVEGDSVVWVAGLGKADVENDVDADENTMFRIGSTSKMFVSLAILKLQEEGKLSLKDKVRDLVPEIEFHNPWQDTAPILVEHLLEHTTGWHDFHLKEYAHNDPKPISLKEGLDFHPHSRTSRWVPGTRMSYSNSGPAVAAYIVEKVSGRTFEDYIQEQFFDPMGMENMTYFESEAYKQLGATLYSNKKPHNYWHIIMRPSGAINASAKDMANLVKFFINRGRVDGLQLIREESLSRMETPSTSSGSKAGLELGYGLSNYSIIHNNYIYRSHGGGVTGGLSDLAYLPNHKKGYSLMINSENGNTRNRISKLIRDFQIKDLESNEIITGKPLLKLEKSISGYYVPINPRIQKLYFLERIIDAKKIWYQNDSIYKKNILGGIPQTFLPIAENQFIEKSAGKIAMVLADDPLEGEVLFLDFRVLKPVSPLLIFGQLSIAGLWLFLLVSSIILGLVWSVRYWMGKVSGGANISIRLWPLIASLFFLIMMIIMSFGFKNSIENFGNISFFSISIMVLSIGFALASVWSVFNIIRNRKAKTNRFFYWYSAILAVFHLTVTVYLLAHGWIGIQSWNN